MPKYDRQLIIVFLAGGGEETIISENAKLLNGKQREEALASEIVPVKTGSALTLEGGSEGFDANDVAQLQKAIKGELAVNQAVTPKSRIYLQGHGSWASQKLACWNAVSVARLLKHVGMPAVDNLNVLGCELARDAGTPHDARISNSIDSFASHLHRRLREPEGLIVTLFARPYRVGVAGPDQVDDTFYWGRKLTANENDINQGTVHHRPGSKYKFFWEGTTQRRECVDSTAESLMEM